MDSITDLEAEITILCDVSKSLRDVDRGCVDIKTDIGPLIRLHKQNPKFIVKFQNMNFLADEEVDSLMDVHASGPWWDYFEEAVTRVLIAPGWSEMQVELLLRPQFAEPWMASERSRKGINYPQEKTDWMVKGGLLFQMIRVYVLVDQE